MNIKSLFTEKFKSYILYYLSSSKEWSEIYKYKIKKKIIVALAADYGNFGDIAISIAQYDWLKKNFPDYEIIDFPISKTYRWTKSLKKCINRDDIITLVGGGNTGDLYWSIELCRQFIIKEFPHNKIVSFPQTVSHNDEKKIRTCINAYGRHKDFSFSFREKYSYDYAKEHFKNKNLVLTPDIALSLKIPQNSFKREDISVILRCDKESVISEEKNRDIIAELKTNNNIKIFDTVFEKTSSLDNTDRREKCYSFLEKIQKSQVVVTNRLHTMVFSAVTQTPCLVLPVIGVKVKGVYDAWLKDLNYITYLDEYDTEKIKSETERLKNIKPNKINLEKDFEPLINAIRN